LKKLIVYALSFTLVMPWTSASARFIQGDPLGIVPIPGAPTVPVPNAPTPRALTAPVVITASDVLAFYQLNHSYGYVNANPLSLSDPTGEFSGLLLILLAGAFTFYGAMSVISSSYNFYTAQNIAQAAQQTLNANLAACTSYPQGGACNALATNRAFYLQCTANMVAAGGRSQ
jgi:hypothetical protein